MNHRIEETLHKVIVDLLRKTAKPDVIWLHIPNGEHRDIRTATKLKLMGVRAGAADLLFIMPGFVAFMELKAPGGSLSKEQIDFQARCEDIGVPYAVVHNIDSAIQRFKTWGILRDNSVFNHASASADRGARAPARFNGARAL